MNIGEKSHSDPAKWICIYPAYINSKKSIAEGRRIPKQKAVENPTLNEMMEALAASGLNLLPENKQYSREKSKEFHVRGRIRVQLKKDDGSLYNPSFPSRESVLLYVSGNIPTLKSRTNKPAEHTKETNKKKGKGKK